MKRESHRQRASLLALKEGREGGYQDVGREAAVPG